MGAPLEEEPGEVQSVRRDLGRLVALETTHVVIGGLVLAVIAVRAVHVAEQSVEVAALTLALLIAFTHLALSVRVRAGQSLLRRELVALELAEERRNSGELARGGAYRSSRLDLVDGRGSVKRWRRLALLLLVGLFALSLASAPMVAQLLSNA